MHAVSLDLLAAALFDAQIIRWVVWVGLVVLTIALLLLVRTRWGQSQPLGKCVVLSLVAHLLFFIFTTTVRIVSSTVGSPDGKGIQVALIDSSAQTGENSDANAAQPWNEPGDGPGLGPDAAVQDIAAAPAAELPAIAMPEGLSRAVESSPPTREITALPIEEAAPPAVSTLPDATKAAIKHAEPIETSSPAALAADVPPPDPSPSPDPAYAPGGGSKSEAKSAAEPAIDMPPPLPAGEKSLAGPGGGDHAKAMPNIYSWRMGNHTQVAKGLGATQDSEAHVLRALKWLASNQSANGRWQSRQFGGGGLAADSQNRDGAGAHADTGITGLALLAFLAAGHTHLQGPYQATVRSGLEFLMSAQAADGNLGNSNNIYEKMYCHAMATCALSEAYAMSGDERLQPTVRRAITFTIRTQEPRSGGWRYRPGDTGDMSQLGWQLMALKSAELAGISIPSSTRDGVQRFLKSVVAGRSGGMARYRPYSSQPASRSMTAEALVCRQFLQMPNSPTALEEASSYLLQDMPGSGEANLYYWYYATIALCQTQGEPWRRWNEALQKTLLASQRVDGDLAGSWDPDPVWGGCGGRAYSTALSALCLEVYYRFLPLFVEAAARDRRAK